MLAGSSNPWPSLQDLGELQAKKFETM